MLGAALSPSEVLTHLSLYKSSKGCGSIIPILQTRAGVSEQFVNFFRRKGKDEVSLNHCRIEETLWLLASWSLLFFLVFSLRILFI